MADEDAETSDPRVLRIKRHAWITSSKDQGTSKNRVRRTHEQNSEEGCERCLRGAGKALPLSHSPLDHLSCLLQVVRDEIREGHYSLAHVT